MLGFASLVTLAIIFGFIFAIVLLAGYYGGYYDIGPMIGLTVLFNFLGWLISPFFMDLMYRFFYKTKRITIEELEAISKPVGEFVKSVAANNNIKIPKLRLILDDNPTAFTFGSGVYNARLCFSQGLFSYLDEDEIKAVIAHEFGHIKRRDFIIMTIASTAIQILYELSQVLAKKRGNRDKKSALALVGLLAYVFYIVGVYLLFFLSRVREYGADEFSARQTGNPDALSRALVKIAYGIVAKPDDAGQMRLLNATRALGPFDPQSAKHLGTAFEGVKGDWKAVSRVVAYDLISPWAKILQLQSTHPLTGKRILRLNEMAKKTGKQPSIETDSIASMPVDKEKLYRGFALGVFMHFLPWIMPLAVILSSLYLKNDRILLLIPAGLGLALLLRIFYKYPSEPVPEKSNTLAMMTDLYASPIRGRSYSLEGTVIGRGVAGAQFSEDIMLKDSAGLIYLNYESAFSFIGNLFFALSSVKKLIGKQVSTSGWFFRGVSHHMDMQYMTSEGKTIRSHPKIWGVIGALLLIGLSLLLMTNSISIPFPS